MKPNSLLLFPLLAILASGCCSYRRGDHHHASHQPSPGHGAVTPLPPPYNPPTYHPPPNPPVVVTPPPVAGQGPGPGQAQLADGETKFELKTQDWSVDKATVSAGTARIRKYIVSENKASPITVCHDEYSVERVPVNQPVSSPWWEGESYVEIPLSKEIATGVTRSRTYEIVRVKKSSVCETNLITGVVKTEKLEVTR